MRTNVKPMSAAKRKTMATQQLLSSLAGDDQTAAITAALEVVNEWLAWDIAFQERLRQKYDELRILTATNTTKKKVELGAAPTPISGRGLDSYSPYGRLDPYQLLNEYGHNQLRAVLQHATQRHLREAVDVVQLHDPDSKPSSRSRNDVMIDFIVEKVAGPGY
jgi:hypothetical protein